MLAKEHSNKEPLYQLLHHQTSILDRQKGSVTLQCICGEITGEILRNVELHYHIFNLLSSLLYVTVPCLLRKKTPTHTQTRASHVICCLAQTDGTSDMTRPMALFTWHNTAHWHSLQHPLLPSLYNRLHLRVLSPVLAAAIDNRSWSILSAFTFSYNPYSPCTTVPLLMQ